MVSQIPASSELYNLRWNSYFSNLINVFTDHQNQEALVDVTIGCEGQFIKAHKLVLSACSVYFQQIFQTHTAPQLLILLNDVKFENLRLVIQFMYKGEVKVADQDMQSFLQLGKMLQVKGLCSVELQEKQKQLSADSRAENKERVPIQDKTKTFTPEISKSKSPQRIVLVEPKQNNRNSVAKNSSETVPKKRKLPSPPPPDPKKKPATFLSEDILHIPRPPNAFMIFANQWRKKLAVEYPNESNKDISVRLGNMWKSLSPETRDGFYEDAKKADEEHKLKYPGYYYSPKEARHRKVIATISKAAQKDPIATDDTNSNQSELIEIKCEDDDDEIMPNNGTN